MPRILLTRLFVDAVACPPGRAKIDFFDLEQRGLMLEVRSSGGKTYYQRYTDARGRERQFKIGPADILTLDQARRRARTILARVVLGTDPQEERAELRTIPTLREFVRARYLPHAQSYKRSWRTDEAMLRLHILPSLGSRAMDEVTSQHIAELLIRMRADSYAPGTTNRALVLLRFIYNLARKWKVPKIMENPTFGLTTAPDAHRNRFLSIEETQRLVAAITTDENRIAGQAIMLLLLTGARRNEVTHAKWEYVDWDKRTLYVPLSKSGKPRTIALSGQAVELLRSVPRYAENPYIFASPITERPSPSLHFPWTRIQRRAGLDGVRLHDLRHSFASFLVNQGVSLYVVQGLLGHLNVRTTQRYAHLAHETLLDAAEVVSTVIGEQKWPGIPGERVPIDGKFPRT